jgi:hypothetical protein
MPEAMRRRAVEPLPVEKDFDPFEDAALTSARVAKLIPAWISRYDGVRAAQPSGHDVASRFLSTVIDRITNQNHIILQTQTSSMEEPQSLYLSTGGCQTTPIIVLHVARFRQTKPPPHLLCFNAT